MNNDEKSSELFEYGSEWIKVDFHLHTRADKQFKYDGADNSYINDYVAELKTKNIRIGVITNHNKFDMKEFKALRKKAKKEKIFLIPGVELSVGDGANGIHTLITFSNDWLENGDDYINQFLNVAFEGKTSNVYENEDGRCSLDLLSTLKKLEGYNRDFFIVFAHVEQNSGLWNELDGGRLKEFCKYEIFKRRVLGFQKVRSRDLRDKVLTYLGDCYPAEVEGSDCKSITEVGKGDSCYLKLGSFSFDAVKFALIDKVNRTAKEAFNYHHSYICSVKFTGGIWNGQELKFSPELNTFIGIRGSGKSSMLEVLRYALEIPFGDKSGDKEYKEQLLGFTLGSGGKVEITAKDRYGELYTIRRIWKEAYSEVLVGAQLQPGISIRETVLHKPIYFGQKDLSNTGEGFEKDLVDKLLGTKLDNIRRKIADQKDYVLKGVENLKNLSDVQDHINEQEKIKQDTEHHLKFYTEHGVKKKLKNRLDFDNDVRVMEKGLQIINNFVSDLQVLLAEYEDDLRNFKGHQSQHNSELFGKFYKKYDTYISLIDNIKKWSEDEKATKEILLSYQKELNEIRKSMVEEFAKIERTLAEELKRDGTQNISSEDFINLNKKLTSANQIIVTLKKQGDQKTEYQKKLLQELQKLNDLWLDEFNLIKKELDKVGEESSSISITSEYKEDKLTFLSFMKDIFRGSNIRGTTYESITDKYVDFIDIYKDFNSAQLLFGSNPQTLSELFMQNLKSLLTYQVPNKFKIMYRGKELQHHSLGQRASALILFVLSQRENDVIIIDQPEDDLDNQTIYEDVIKLICRMKPNVQFIFATHNPNIPVLGDAEQVHACSFTNESVSVNSGSLDNPETQKTIINIMEGGKEAFDRRKEIYQIWKS